MCPTSNDSTSIGDALREIVAAAVPRLQAIGPTESERRPSPTAWSIREVLGHLVDSAQHNHARFIRAQMVPSLVFDGYDQDECVRLQRYHRADWPNLITLWSSYNRHLAHVMSSADFAALHQRREPHNLGEITFRPPTSDSDATLAYLMEDYVLHLQHHLNQIWRIAQ